MQQAITVYDILVLLEDENGDCFRTVRLLNWRGPILTIGLEDYGEYLDYESCFLTKRNLEERIESIQQDPRYDWEREHPEERLLQKLRDDLETEVTTVKILNSDAGSSMVAIYV